MVQIDVVIITALKDEWDALRAVSSSTWQTHQDSAGFSFEQTQLAGLNIVLARLVWV